MAGITLRLLALTVWILGAVAGFPAPASAGDELPFKAETITEPLVPHHVGRAHFKLPQGLSVSNASATFFWPDAYIAVLEDRYAGDKSPEAEIQERAELSLALTQKFEPGTIVREDVPGFENRRATLYYYAPERNDIDLAEYGLQLYLEYSEGYLEFLMSSTHDIRIMQARSPEELEPHKKRLIEGAQQIAPYYYWAKDGVSVPASAFKTKFGSMAVSQQLPKPYPMMSFQTEHRRLYGILTVMVAPPGTERKPLESLIEPCDPKRCQTKTRIRELEVAGRKGREMAVFNEPVNPAETGLYRLALYWREEPVGPEDSVPIALIFANASRSKASVEDYPLLLGYWEALLANIDW